MRETLRGALLSVLFFGGLALFALPAMAQSDSGQSPDGSTTCGGGNCASNGTVDAGNNSSSGTPGAGNPLGGNPLGGGLTGGMGDPAPVDTPNTSLVHDVAHNGISAVGRAALRSACSGISTPEARFSAYREALVRTLVGAIISFVPGGQVIGPAIITFGGASLLAFETAVLWCQASGYA